MNCPECGMRIELNWRRYALAPFGRFRCPSCSTKFKFIRPLWYWLLPLAQCIVILLGGIGIISHMVGDPTWGQYAKPSVIVLTVGTIIIFLVIDKSIEKRFETVKV